LDAATEDRGSRRIVGEDRLNATIGLGQCQNVEEAGQGGDGSYDYQQLAFV
jgi:hypothetical protein